MQGAVEWGKFLRYKIKKASIQKLVVAPVFVLLAGILLCSTRADAQSSSRINRVIQLWQEGKPAIGHGVKDFSFDQAVRWSRSDYDFLFCDMEHRPLNLTEMRVFLQALLDRKQRGNNQMRPTPFLRVPTRVFGFLDPAKQEVSAGNSQGVGGAL